MPIPPIRDPSGARSLLAAQPSKPDPKRAPAGSDRAAKTAAGGSAAVRFSQRAHRLDAQQQLLSRLLTNVEQKVSGADDVFEQAGRSEYLEKIASPSDLSPEATAGRILGGITGYIYGAFRLQHPKMTSEDFERFESEAMRGFEQGMGEARELLEAIEVLDGKLAGEIGETERLVREGLDRFFGEESERLRRAKAS